VDHGRKQQKKEPLMSQSVKPSILMLVVKVVKNLKNLKNSVLISQEK